MKKKTLFTVITILVTLGICTLAAMYTPPGFGHCVTMVTKDGGISRHPVFLGLDRDKYVILVTGTVLPPYRGSFRVVLEGEPKVKYRVYSSYPPDIYLNLTDFHKFSDNTVTGISPFDKYSLAVCIEPDERIMCEADYRICFYDLESDNQVLTIPVTFRDLVNFHISKDVRRPYPPECHTTGVSGWTGKKDKSITQ